jgi:RNA polymerase sigma-70 factor (ECF subfamily)
MSPDSSTGPSGPRPAKSGRKPRLQPPPIEQVEDGEVVRRVLAGEEELFELLVRRYQVRVVSHVTRMVGSRDDAMDLAQEIFLKVFQALDRFNPAYKFSTWLFRIAGNAAIDHLRKRRPRTVPLESPDPEGPGPFPPEQRSTGLDPYGELRNVERGRAISEAIQELPPDFRELIALRHFAGLSYEEIAEVKKLPLGTVKNKLFRARVVLKERLSGEVT